MAGRKRAASPTRASSISPPPLKRKIESTVTSKTVAAFFTPASQKKPNQITWRIVRGSLVIGKYATDDSRQETVGDRKQRVAAFDLDSTLISTASGNTFARNATDWKWWHSTVPTRIRDLNSKGYQVVIMSNQKKISIQKELKAGRSDSKSLTNFKEKVAAVMRQLDIPMSVYAATEDDESRKPRVGMWREFLDDYDLDVRGVDLAGSVFVGDAAGRPRDHSSSDRGFAANIGIPFKTPEEFFLDATPESFTSPFDPALYLTSDSSDPPPPPFSRKNPIELVIFVGSPGAGKSTFYWNHLQPLGYERVNQDILKTRQKCIKVAREHLSSGKSVAVDNTNPDPETRSYWIDLARDLNVPIRCVYLAASASPELCRHNNAVRAANRDLNPESRSLVPRIAFSEFARRFREPVLDEGFQDVVRVEFRFQGTETTKKIWSQYWI